MNIAFAGTPEFAQAALARLHAEGHQVSLVLTQPDRLAGRGMRLQASAVKEFSLAHGLAVIQPNGLRLDGRHAADARAAHAALQAARPEVMVVAAYGLILPAWTLALPPCGCINIHASLLPRWRGAAPIHRAIEAGDAETGVTIMQMDAGLDTGAMLLAEAVPIGATDTTATLQRRLAALGAGLVADALRRLASLAPRPQPDDGISYAEKVRKDEAPIDWRCPAEVIERRLRAFDPFPGASAVLGGDILKCWHGHVVDGVGAPGEVLAADAAGLRVACGQAALLLTQLQRPGGRRVSAAEFLQRARCPPGMRFELPGPER